MMLGVHCSVKGGLINAVTEAKNLNTDTFQLFTTNPRQWKGRVVSDEEGRLFKAALKKAGIRKAFAHTSYLLNLSSANETMREASILALAAEVQRCEILGLDYCILHPGQSKVLTEAETIAVIADGLKLVIDHSAGYKVKILLENTAGQGSTIGWKFEHLRDIMQAVSSDRLGVCIDTCHAFASGYDIRTQSAFEDTISLLDSMVGLENVLAFHLNDSKGALGSRIDRHEHIGSGKIGTEPFRLLMKNFPHVPKVLETDHEDDLHIRDLEILRGLMN
jgi:deoxyribonuclease-4